jgi:hypothetical protein
MTSPENTAPKQRNQFQKGPSGNREAMPMTAIEEFKAIVIMANRVARWFNDGALDTCVLTSYALAAALTDLGYADARPVRVQAASFPEDRNLLASILGSTGAGRRATDGYWWGHLAVCIGQSWLLDPTLDQSNDADGWVDAGIGVEPVAAPLTPEFWDLDLQSSQRLLWVHFSAVSTRYMLVPQKGFARAPNARPSHWRPLATEITKALRWLEQVTIGGASVKLGGSAARGGPADGFGLKAHSEPTCLGIGNCNT